MSGLKLWQRVGLALGCLAIFEAVSRFVSPMFNVPALAQYLHNGGGSFIMRLYDALGGGGLSRGGALALGLMPYLSASIMMRLARVVVPPMDAMSETARGRTRLTRWTRALTVGLAMIQSYGFARFVEGIPGAVTHPGTGFIVRTMLALTSGSVVVMMLAEHITRSLNDDDDDDHEAELPASPDVLLGPGAIPGFAEARAGEKADARR